MAAYKERKDMTVPELCAAFETDIYIGMHTFRTEYRRSLARQELERRGAAILSEVEAYRAVPSLYASDGTAMSKNVATAWSLLLETLTRNPQAAAG